MEQNRKLLWETKRLMLSRYPRFGSEIASANIEYKRNLPYRTAGTDGKNIYFDPDYLASLGEDDRLFVIAHELMHIKFAHVFRLIGKDGEKRDSDIWNQATDAIINANLERDGFKIKEGYINRPEALNYSAEEFYQLLLQEKQEQQEQQNGERGDKGESSDDDNQQQEENEAQHQHSGDDHSLWEEAFEQSQNPQNDKQSQSQSKKDGEQQPTQTEVSNSEVDESSEFSENRQQRKAVAEENMKRMREQMLRDSVNMSSVAMNLGSVGADNNTIDWRLLVRREIDKSETIWSQNRSIAENNYAYRLEENDIEDEAETEVMIDVSGSVDLDMVRAFLRMLKPLLKESKLKVGCFNEKYWGMTEIKSVRDIDNFIIPQEARGHSAWTEDWDLAVRSFTKKREINKIVFTDGNPCPGNFPKEDLRHESVIWIVYGNRNFKPCCGKVIQITEEQLGMLQLCQIDGESKGRSR